MIDGNRLRGGELNCALTRELVGIHTEYLGRGPASASTFYRGNVVVTLMRDVLTRAEKVLAFLSANHIEPDVAAAIFILDEAV